MAAPPLPAPAQSAHRNREALELARPSTVTLSAFDEHQGLEGTAADFDEVSEFMRRLNNIVWCSRGWATVVERARDGRFRVELPGSGVLLDLAAGNAEFPFAGTEPVSTELLPSGHGVSFKLRFLLE